MPQSFALLYSVLRKIRYYQYASLDFLCFAAKNNLANNWITIIPYNSKLQFPKLKSVTPTYNALSINMKQLNTITDKNQHHKLKKYIGKNFELTTQKEKDDTRFCASPQKTRFCPTLLKSWFFQCIFAILYQKNRVFFIFFYFTPIIFKIKGNQIFYPIFFSNTISVQIGTNTFLFNTPTFSA